VFRVVRLLVRVTVAVVVLFRLGRLVDHRGLGGVELQTRVPCSLSGSLELRTLLPAVIGSYKPARYEPAPAGQIVIVAAFRSSTASMGFGYIDGDVPRTPNTFRRHPLAAKGIGRYVSRSDATGGGPCSGGK
jgi:hypothetical protein